MTHLSTINITMCCCILGKNFNIIINYFHFVYKLFMCSFFTQYITLLYTIYTLYIAICILDKLNGRYSVFAVNLTTLQFPISVDYIFIQFNYWSTPLRASIAYALLSLTEIVVEPSSIRGLAADCPFFSTQDLTIYYLSNFFYFRCIHT